jgi:hypothetical protein
VSRWHLPPRPRAAPSANPFAGRWGPGLRQEDEVSSTMAFRPASSSLLFALVGMRSVLSHRSGTKFTITAACSLSRISRRWRDKWFQSFHPQW